MKQVSPARLARLCFENQTSRSVLLGLDVSPSAVGVAMSLPNMSQAVPLQTLDQHFQLNKRSELYKTTNTVYSLLEVIHSKRPVLGLVVGWPLDLGMQPGENCVYVDHFVQVLQSKLKEAQLSVPIVLWDEFNTTKLAQTTVEHTGFQTKRIDHHAATFILQSYLDRHFN
ncbi:hypothetical protein BASA81_007110 [Batrachochytrium salamandrivorans]|nr:hypothetical protein BASA81_007110 [Batrachochytrium salamandrivorans]